MSYNNVLKPSSFTKETDPRTPREHPYNIQRGNLQTGSQDTYSLARMKCEKCHFLPNHTGM